MKHWKPTEEQLRLAMANLPREKTTEVQEYLDHNELGLAWDGMQEIADELGIVTAEFWRPMAKAAGLMASLGDILGQNKLENNKMDRERGCLFGLAVGDALGAPIEFKSPGEFAPVSEFRSGGPFGLKAGEWTDDTSLALALADSIGHGWDLNDQGRRYLAWWQRGQYSVNGRCFDIGSTTSTSLYKFDETGDAWNCADKNAENSGNGSIMRLAPVPIKYHNLDRKALAEKARESSLVTHASEQCLSSCEYLATVVAALINGASKEEALNITFTGLHPLVQKWIVDEKKYMKSNPPEIKGDGWVIKSLEAALWAFYGANNFEEAVLRAVNLGDDSDSTGAVCGQLAGACWGESGIPKRWLDKLARKDMLENAMNLLVGGVS